MRVWCVIIKRVRRRKLIVGRGRLAEGTGDSLFPRRCLLPPGVSRREYHPYVPRVVESRIAVNRRPRKRGGS